jgi:serine/threonine-protein kinase HipA
MTISKPQQQECYVYMTLPGATLPVTAGRFVLRATASGIIHGEFYYGKKYLALPSAVAIDPVELKLSDKIYNSSNSRGLFGALRDAGPDFWGRQIIERNVSQPELSEVDYLLYAPDDHAGALNFGLGVVPPAPKQKFNQTIELEKLQEIADGLVSNESVTAIANTAQSSVALQIENLLLIGTSIGGARPKAIIEDQQALWIAKFNRYDDKWNNAKVEHAMLTLGRLCGINTAESRVITVAKRDVLLVKRFDREKIATGYTRARMISASTVLMADDVRERHKWSYVYLAEALRRISQQPMQDAQELFKRMCFNALISNLDDHPRNHALLAQTADWRLSPAYDLTPATPISTSKRDLAMACGDKGRAAQMSNLLTQHLRFGLEFEAAQALINNMATLVANNWRKVAVKCGVHENDCDRISSAFVYPGFWD